MPFDIIGIIVILGVFFGAVLYFGKSAGISIIFSLPISAFLYNNFPFKDKFISLAGTGSSVEWLKIVLLTLFLILSYMIVRRAVYVLFSWNDVGKITEATIISVIITGLIAVLVASYISPDVVTEYFPVLEKLISIPYVLFWWLLGSMLSLFLILND